MKLEKTLVSAISVIFAFSANSADVRAISSLQGLCVDANHRTASEWKQSVDTIVSASVTEVQAGVIGTVPSNRCWAHLAITKAFKGKLGGSVWLNVTYSEVGYPFKKLDLFDPESCPVQPGNEYLIFGFERSDVHQVNGNEPLILSGFDPNPKNSCTPIIEIDKASTLIRDITNP